MMQFPRKTVAIYFVDWYLISLSLGVIKSYEVSCFQVIVYTATFFFLFSYLLYLHFAFRIELSSFGNVFSFS